MMWRWRRVFEEQHIQAFLMGLSKLMVELIKNFFSCSWKRSWLLLKSSLPFSKRTFFLSGLIFTNAMAEHSFLGFLIVFIKTNSDGDNMRLDAVISTAKDCFSAFLASFLVFITHDRISPFIMILVTHAIFIAGMLTLLRAPFQINGVFCLALALLSVNKSGMEYIEEFADESAVGDLEQVIDDKKKPNITTVGDLEQIMDDEKKPNITPIDAWLDIGWIVGAITGLVLTSNFSLMLMPMISAIVGAIGCIFFGSYRIRYKESLGHHQERKQELNHEIRALLKLFPELLPLWTPFLIYYVVDAAGSTFFIEQGKVLYYEEAYLYMVQQIVGFMVSNLINSGITKFSSKRDQPKWVTTTVTKITFGLFICFLLCLLSWHVEASRLQSIKNNQDPKIILHFVIFLQFILLGTMKNMVEEMLGKLFCDHADESMHHLEFTFNRIVEGMGRLLAVACILVFQNWIGDTIDKSHLDKYYRALTFISLCACVIFIYLSYIRYWKKETEDHDSLTKKMEEGGLTSEPQSFSLHSSPQWSAHFSADESTFASSEHSLRSSTQSSAYFSADECSSLQSSAYLSADEYHFASSGNSQQSSPQSSAYLSSDESIFASSEQTSLFSTFSGTRPSTKSKWLKSLTFPNRFPPAKEISNDYQRSRTSVNNLRYRSSAKAISHSEGPSEIN